jgi:uncharacterized RDD family membrane protein YckC
MAIESPVRAEDGSLVGAAHGGYVWLIVNRPDGPTLLLHHDDFYDHYDTENLYAQELMTLQHMPEAVIARDNRIWMIHPPDARTDHDRREVFTLSVERIPGMNQFVASPQDRLQVAPPLPGGGRLVATATSKEGPLALIVPYEHERIEIAQPPGADMGDPVPSEPQLLYLQGNTWSPLTLPPDQVITEHTFLTSAGTDGEAIVLLGGDGGESVWAARRDTQGAWSRGEVVVSSTRLLGAADSGIHPMMFLAGDDENALKIALLKGFSVHPLVEIETLAPTWITVGRPDGAWVISTDPAGATHIVEVHGLSGGISEPKLLGPIPVALADRYRMPAVLVIVFISVILLSIYKPGSTPPAQLRENQTILPPSGRAQALLIDLVPGALIACFTLKCEPIALLGLPFSTALFEQSAPYLIMAGVTLGHTTLSEVIWRTTLGKSMKRAQVRNANGAALSIAQVLLRNLVKALMLIAPPLAIIALTNPNMQTLHDLVARAVVVQSKPPREDD